MFPFEKKEKKTVKKILKAQEEYKHEYFQALEAEDKLVI